jgi:hypothetical protein
MTAAEWMAPWAPPSSAAYAAPPAAQQQGCQNYPSGMVALQQVDYCNGMQYYSQDASAAYAASALVGSAGAARASLVRTFARASAC